MQQRRHWPVGSQLVKLVRGRLLGKAASNRSQPLCVGPSLLRFRPHRATLWSHRLTPVPRTNTDSSRRWSNSSDPNHVSSPYTCHQSSSSILRKPLDLHCNKIKNKNKFERNWFVSEKRRWFCNAVRVFLGEINKNKNNVLIEIDDWIGKGDVHRVL